MGRAAVLGVVGCMVMAGCSGGGSGDGGQVEFPPDPRSFDALTAARADLEAEMAGLEFTDPSSLPTTGSANYQGIIVFEATDNDFPAEIAGDIELAVGFGGSEGGVTATATNFAGSGGEQFEGELRYDGRGFFNDVDPNGGGWTYEQREVHGSLDGEDGTHYSVASGYLQGDFRGDEHEHADGVSLVQLIPDTGSSIFLNGEFAASR